MSDGHPPDIQPGGGTGGGGGDDGGGGGPDGRPPSEPHASHAARTWQATKEERLIIVEKM